MTTTVAPIRRPVDSARAQAIRQRYKANRGRTHQAVVIKSDRFTQARHAEIDRMMDDAMAKDSA